MHIFITFASTGLEDVGKRIEEEAKLTHFFSEFYIYNEKDLSTELLSSPTFQEKRGFGLYSWKSDIILQTLEKANEGDIIVYLDAGCVINANNKWDNLVNELNGKDILTFLIHQRNYMWVRKNVFDYYSTSIPYNWKEMFQCGANAIVVRKSPVSVKFISEWRNIMINRLDLCGDAPEEELSQEDPRFIKNRYDQTILTALAYKYYPTGKVKLLWEHFEGKDILSKQAFIAARKRAGRNERDAYTMRRELMRIIRTSIIYPFYTFLIRHKYNLPM